MIFRMTKEHSHSGMIWFGAVVCTIYYRVFVQDCVSKFLGDRSNHDQMTQRVNIVTSNNHPAALLQRYNHASKAFAFGNASRLKKGFCTLMFYLSFAEFIGPPTN